MPYFERKPYKEMIASLAPKASRAADDPPFEDLARAILSSETGPQHALDGPFECATPIAPGHKGHITLNFAARGDGPPLELSFTTSDLHGPEGHVLPADLIDVKPASLSLSPGQSSDVVVSVTVPTDRSPGQYQGRVTAMGSEPTAIVVRFTVS